MTVRGIDDWLRIPQSPLRGLLVVPSPSGGRVRVGASPLVREHWLSRDFTLTPALSFKGEGELKDPNRLSFGIAPAAMR